MEHRVFRKPVRTFKGSASFDGMGLEGAKKDDEHQAGAKRRISTRPGTRRAFRGRRSCWRSCCHRPLADANPESDKYPFRWHVVSPETPATTIGQGTILARRLMLACLVSIATLCCSWFWDWGSFRSPSVFPCLMDNCVILIALSSPHSKVNQMALSSVVTLFTGDKISMGSLAMDTQGGWNEGMSVFTVRRDADAGKSPKT